MPLVLLSDGSTPRRTDARWPILVKWLLALQANALYAYPQNNPRRDDTRRILLQKILGSLTGIPYHG